MIESEYPRVLFVAHRPLATTPSVAITVGSLLHGWPKDRLAQVYIGAEDPDVDVFGEHYRLDPRCKPCDYYCRRWFGKHPFSGAPELAAMPRGDEGRSTLRGRLHLWARTLNDMGPLVVPEGLTRWARAYAPDVIYSLLGTVTVMKLVIMLSRCSGKSVVPHFMDDWVTARYPSAMLGGFPQRSLLVHLRRVLEQTSHGLCIGDDMAAEYQRRYCRPFHGIMNSVDDTWFTEPSCCSQRRTVVTYVGGLHLNRWQSLATVAEIANRCGAESRIFAPMRDVVAYGARFALIRGVRMASLAANEVIKELREATLLVHCESFDTAAAQYARLSVSTKIPQYMAAGKAILGYGPGDLSSMKLIERAGAGMVVGEADHQKLASAVARMIQDGEARHAFARNAYRYAWEHFRRSRVHHRFRRVLMMAAGVEASGPGGSE